MRKLPAASRIHPAFKTVFTFFVIRRFLFASAFLFMLFCLLIAVIALFFNHLIKYPTTFCHLLIFGTSFVLLALFFFWVSLPFHRNTAQGMLKFSASASKKAFDLISPFMTKNMHASDAQTVLELLSKKINEFVSRASLAKASVKHTNLVLILLAAGLIFLFLPVNDIGVSPIHKFDRCKAFVIGPEWLKYQELRIVSVYPGDSMVKSEAPWLVRVEFNRDIQPESRNLVRFGGIGIPLEKVRPGVYQALMPPLTTDTANYHIQVEGRKSGAFNIRSSQSAEPVMQSTRSVFNRYETKLDAKQKPWDVLPGSEIEIVLRAPGQADNILLEGSGGLYDNFSFDSASNLWTVRFIVYEAGAFSFKWRDSDGTEAVSEIFPINTLEDMPPSVKLVRPSDLEAMKVPKIDFAISVDDDAGISSIRLYMNNMHGHDFQSELFAFSDAEQPERTIKEIRMDHVETALVTSSIAAVVAEAADNSVAGNNSFSGITFHPVVKVGENELLDTPEAKKLFNDWLNRGLNRQIDRELKQDFIPPEKREPDKESAENKPDEKASGSAEKAQNQKPAEDKNDSKDSSEQKSENKDKNENKDLQQQNQEEQKTGNLEVLPKTPVQNGPGSSDVPPGSSGDSGSDSTQNTEQPGNEGTENSEAGSGKSGKSSDAQNSQESSSSKPGDQNSQESSNSQDSQSGEETGNQSSQDSQSESGTNSQDSSPSSGSQQSGNTSAASENSSGKPAESSPEKSGGEMGESATPSNSDDSHGEAGGQGQNTGSGAPQEQSGEKNASESDNGTASDDSAHSGGKNPSRAGSEPRKADHNGNEDSDDNGRPHDSPSSDDSREREGKTGQATIKSDDAGSFSDATVEGIAPGNVKADDSSKSDNEPEKSNTEWKDGSSPAEAADPVKAMGEEASGDVKIKVNDVEIEIRAFNSVPSTTISKSEFEKQLKRYEEIRSRMSREEQRALDEYYKRLREFVRDE